MSGELVYVRGLRGAEAEKWPDDATSGAMVGKTILARRRLSDAEWPMSLGELERRYPPPASPISITVRCSK